MAAYVCVCVCARVCMFACVSNDQVDKEAEHHQKFIDEPFYESLFCFRRVYVVIGVPTCSVTSLEPTTVARLTML